MPAGQPRAGQLAPEDPHRVLALLFGAALPNADELTIVRRRPELADDLLGDEPPDGLTLVHELTEHGRTTRVYAFTPAPPPSDEPPIYLGYVSD